MAIPRIKLISAFICAASTPSLVLAETQDTLVVTATGFEQKIQNAPASISVITKQQIEDKAYRDITDALRDVPGVVVTGGGSSSDISIRGMSSQYTLFLIDGKRISTRGTRPNSDNAGIEQGWMPPLESIERIEVIRGPMSSLYGSDAMGGVINVITKKTSNTRGWTGSLHGDATFQENNDSGDLFQTDFYASGPLIEGLLGAKVTGLLSRRAEDKILNGYNEQKMRNGSVALNLTPDEKNDFDLDISRELQDRNSTPGESAAIDSSKSESRYEHTTYALTHHGYYDDFNTTTYVQQEKTNNPGRDMESYNTILNNQNQLFLGDHTLTLGGQYRYEKLKDDGNQLEAAQGLNKLTRWSWALFSEDEWAMTDSFTLTGGLRMDKDENYGTHWTPRGYGVWHLTEQWTLKGGVSAGYRSPDLRQSSASWGQVTGGGRLDGIIVGNPDLKPEKSLSEEIALLWDNNDNLNAGITLFNTDFKDKITEVRRCNSSADPACRIGNHSYDFVSDRVNVDKANMRGVESTFGWKITKTLNLSSNYTYTESEQKSGQFSGKPLNKMPKHMFNSTLDWQATPDVGFWSRLNLRGKTSEYLSRTSMAESTPSYTLVDVGLRYNANKDMTVSAGVYNVFDKTIDYNNYGTILDGRRYTLGLTYNF
ncbi:ligand-gated channel protein [Enterobacteriaceae bacterium H20N1]|uniref:Ligand-gated channel protein n=1 Tax=Dryocola boscaweniae TaxID=2925397 RepID=A0A9X2W942_9ENTR|nr:ligand-gated channel protein [Dryocola boscaweniae]MCT4702492.1 ligand-gated channel protein [Dryocola boscaweniae]MCT4716471.1 ligand-gated channel protein [Dryocola boscaweniae]MCT4719660.1 ligand-gated channel protein [Dryocola boscaweniae]